jgi:hypothetical protein
MSQSDIRGLPEGCRILLDTSGAIPILERGSEPHSGLGISPFVPEPGTGIKIKLVFLSLRIAIAVAGHISVGSPGVVKDALRARSAVLDDTW